MNQTFSIKESRWKCLLQAAALLLLSLPLLRSSCRLVCFFPPPLHSQHSQGGNGKWWVTFKHFHPFHSTAALFVLASEVLIGGEELSLAGCQEFSLGWCKFGNLTPFFWIAIPLSDSLVFLRTLLTYLCELDFMECFNFGRSGIQWQLGQFMVRAFMSFSVHVLSQLWS